MERPMKTNYLITLITSILCQGAKNGYFIWFTKLCLIWHKATRMEHSIRMELTKVVMVYLICLSLLFSKTLKMDTSKWFTKLCFVWHKVEIMVHSKKMELTIVIITYLTTLLITTLWQGTQNGYYVGLLNFALSGTRSQVWSTQRDWNSLQ